MRFNQLDSDRGYYTWAWEKEKNLWAIVWKDRNVVPVISNRYGVDPELIERGGGGKYKTAKLTLSGTEKAGQIGQPLCRLGKIQ